MMVLPSQALDGQRVQTGRTAKLIFEVPELISYCGRWMSETLSNTRRNPMCDVEES